MKTVAEIKAIHDLTNTDIAKEIRNDLKEAFGKDFKFSVTCPNNSIDIDIMEWNIDFYTKEYTEAKQKEDWDTCRQLKTDHLPIQWIYKYYSRDWEKILKRIEEFRNLYNHDKSDLMTDYFDVNYYGGVSIGKWNKKYINTAS